MILGDEFHFVVLVISMESLDRLLIGWHDEIKLCNLPSKKIILNKDKIRSLQNKSIFLSTLFSLSLFQQKFM